MRADTRIEASLARGDYGAALALCDSIIAAGGGDTHLLEQKARAAAGLGRDDAALALFEESLIGDYADCEGHLNFAVFLMERGKTGRAITELDVAKRFCAGDNLAIIHRNMAVLRIKQDQTEAALKEVKAGLGINAGDTYLLGLEAMLIADTDPVRAESLFVHITRAGALEPEHLQPFALLLLEKGRPAAAAKLLAQAAEHDPGNREVRLNLAKAYIKDKRYSDAEDVLKSLLAGDDGRARTTLAGLYFRLERFADAIAQYAALPPSAEIMDRIGMSHYGLGDTDAALAWARKAVAARPDWPVAMINLAVILAARGELDEAASLLERVLEIDPDNATARVNLERITDARRGNP
jgi:tetratricopeptide (TPR) repeat protein